MTWKENGSQQCLSEAGSVVLQQQVGIVPKALKLLHTLPMAHNFHSLAREEFRLKQCQSRQSRTLARSWLVWASVDMNVVVAVVVC
jgi:hypothetical protein